MAQSNQLSAQNPWPGLRAFTEGDREFFFGRERETSELLELVQHSFAVVLYGQSGLGKTSLLQAGLFPELKRLDFLPVCVRFDHGDSATPLADQVKSELAAGLDSVKSSAPRPAQNETLWEYFHRRDVDFWGPRNRLLTPVIVLDQFEEVFTLGQRNEQTAARVVQFARELEAVLERRAPEAVRKRLDANPQDATCYDLDRQPVIFLISLREDFLPDLDPWRARIPSLLAKRFRLERMTGAQALDVVQRAGQDLLDSGAAREIVDFVSKSKHELAPRAMEERDVEPALLSVVSDELNRRRIERGKSKISVDLLTDEREEIIQDFYERAFDGVSPRVRDWVEDKLLTASGYRNRAALEDAVKEGLPEADFDLLVNRRILHREERDRVVWLELTHDLLSDPASQSRSVREHKRQDEAAQEREAKYAQDLRRSRALVTLFGVLLIAAGIALFFAIHSKHRADNALTAAERAQTESTANYQHAADMAETMSFRIGGTNWIPAATVLKDIADANKAYGNLSQKDNSSADLRKPHAGVLIRAADVLYQIGHFEDGLKSANEALDILSESVGSNSKSEGDRLRQSQALYEKGTGQLALGLLSDADNSFNSALDLIKTATNADANHDYQGVRVLSEIGLGETDIQRLDYEQATKHFQRAQAFITPSRDDDVIFWKALALKGLGSSAWNENAAVKSFSHATKIVDEVLAHNINDLRWKMLRADIAYREGRAYKGLSQFGPAELAFKQSVEDAQDLCNRDCPRALDPKTQNAPLRDDENWQWRFILMQSWRGLGELRSDQHEPDSSQPMLEAAARIGKTLTDAQPRGIRATLSYASVVSILGQLQQKRFTLAVDQARAPDTILKLQIPTNSWDYSEATSKLYDQSGAILMQALKTAPQVLQFNRNLVVNFYNQGSLRSALADATDPPKLQKLPHAQLPKNAPVLNRAALESYNQALRQLKTIEGKTKSSPEVTEDEGWVYGGEGNVFQKLGKKDEAIDAYSKSLASWKELLNLQRTPDSFENLARAYFALGEAYKQKNDMARAGANYDAAKEPAAKALINPPESERPLFLGESALIHSRIADMQFARGDMQGALNELEEAIKQDWQGLQSDFSDSWLLSNLQGMRSAKSPVVSLDTLQAALKDPDHSPSSSKARLSPEQIKTFAARIDKLRTTNDPTNLLGHFGHDYSISDPDPLLTGTWQVVVDAGQRDALCQEITRAARNVKADQIQAIRRLPLDFYDAAALYEADVKMKNKIAGVITFVRYGDHMVLLDGTSEAISKMNQSSPPKLDTPDRAIAYLRFFMAAVQDPDVGRVRIIDRPADLDWQPSASAEDRQSIAGEIKPLILEASPDRDWQAIGTIVYGDDLYEASFNVARVGTVAIKGVKSLKLHMPILVDSFMDGIRTQQTMEAVLQENIKRKPDETAYAALIRIYVDGKRWREAAETQKNWVAYLQQHGAGDDHAQHVLNAYVKLDASEMFARDFSGALATADMVKKIYPDDLTGDELRAHALLFLGRSEEATAIYLANSGKKLKSEDWTGVIFGDLNYFKQNGLTSPDSNHIVGLLAVDVSERKLKTNPNDKSALQILPQAYFTLKRYQDAAVAEKHWINFIQHDPMNEPERNNTLRGEYGSLVWYQLFAHDFDGAWASCNTGRKLAGEYIPLEMNCAHALLFLGRVKEAEAIYTKYPGQKVFANSDRTWSPTVLQDFKDLQSAELDSPEIPRLQKLLSSERK